MERREEQEHVQRMEAEGPEVDDIAHTPEGNGPPVSRRGLPGLQGAQLIQFP